MSLDDALSLLELRSFIELSDDDCCLPDGLSSCDNRSLTPDRVEVNLSDTPPQTPPKTWKVHPIVSTGISLPTNPFLRQSIEFRRLIIADTEKLVNQDRWNMNGTSPTKGSSSKYRFEWNVRGN
jgi:hypothetical protein